MNIYISAAYARRLEMALIASTLAAQGFNVTSAWHNDPAFTNDVYAAKVCISDIECADVLVAYTQTPDMGYTSGGRHVEFGYAIAQGIYCVVIGPRENVFHHLPEVRRFDTLDAWIESVRL